MLPRWTELSPKESKSITAAIKKCLAKLTQFPGTTPEELARERKKTVYNLGNNITAAFWQIHANNTTDTGEDAGSRKYVGASIQQGEGDDSPRVDLSVVHTPFGMHAVGWKYSDRKSIGEKLDHSQTLLVAMVLGALVERPEASTVLSIIGSSGEQPVTELPPVLINRLQELLR